MTNKFATAHDWLTEAVNNGTVKTHELLLLIQKVDSDDIQDQFQSLMDVDGYFDDEDTNSDEGDNKKIRIAGHNVEYWYDDEWDHEIEDNDSDFEHIQELLIQDYVEGEIVTYDNDEEETHDGWWKKVK